MLSVVPWSRMFNEVEALCAINMDPDAPRSAWVVEDKNGAAAVFLTVPAAGCVVFK